MFYTEAEPQSRFFKMDFLILFSLFFSVIPFITSVFADDITPVDIIQQNHLSEIRQLSPNAYVHSMNGFVFVENGVFVLPARDLEIPIGSSLFIFERTYNSKVVNKGIFGKGWKFNYGLSVEEMGSNILLTEQGGGVFLFEKMPDSVYVFDINGYRTIVKNVDGSFVYHSDDVTHYFDRTGRLVRVENGNMRYYLSYEKDKLISIGDIYSPFLRFKYNPKGFIEEIEDMSGRRSSFQYDDNGNLIKEINFNRQTTMYTYDGDNHLVSIQYNNGAEVSTAYDKNGRVTLQSGPYGNTTRYQYITEKGIRKTVTTNALNERMEYIFREDGRDVEITVFAGGKIYKKYDSRKNLVEYKDQTGQIMTFVYNDKNQLTSKRLFDGTIEYYTYEPDTWRLSSVRKRRQEIRLTYNPAGLITSISDNLGMNIRYEYDQNRNLINVIDYGNRMKSFEYDRMSRVKKIIFPDGTLMSYSYDVYGNINEITDFRGNKIKYFYDSKGKLTRQIDQIGNIEDMVYDRDGNIIEYKDASGRITSFTYNLYSQIISKEEGGGRTNFEYDARGRLLNITYPDGGKIIYDYNPLDLVTGIIDQLGRKENYKYDRAGRLIERTYPDGRKESYKYNHKGLLSEIYTPGGHRTVYAYDGHNRLVSVSSGDKELRYEYNQKNEITTVLDVQRKSRTTYKYDDYGRIIETDETGSERTFYKYDTWGRLVELKTEGGYGEKYIYDSSGNVIEARYAGGDTIKNHYDPLNRLVKTESHIYGVSSYMYDAPGNLAVVKSAVQGTKGYGYDRDSNSLVSVMENGAETRYGYDIAGNLTEIVDTNGNSTKYEYDLAGRLKKIINSEGHKREFFYDVNNNLIKIVREDNKTEKFSYDLSGILRKMNVDKKTLMERFYDKDGRLTKDKGDGYAFSYKYDNTGNIIEKSDDINKLTIKYKYDSSNNLIGVELPENKRISYTYDNTGNIKEIKSGNASVSINYDRYNRREEIRFGNAIKARYSYNSNGRVKAIQYLKSEGDVIYYISYKYDEAGRISSIDYNGKIFTYSYHDGSMLKEVTYPDGKKEIFSYDKSGNMISLNNVRFSYNSLNQLISKNDVQFRYDMLGNLTEVKAQGSHKKYAYTEGNKLGKVLLGDRKSVKYQYDAEGNLIKTESGKEGRYYIQDSDEIVAEFTGGKLNAIYLTGADIDERISVIIGDKPFFYITDIQNNVIGLINEKGGIENSYLYEPFGNLLVVKENIPNIFYFQGRYLDKETGLYNYRFRWYDPKAMRFIQRDPILPNIFDPDSFNLYVFTRNNPVNLLDPMGLQSYDGPKIQFKDVLQKDIHRGFEKTLTRFQQGKIPANQYGRIPDGFRDAGVIEKNSKLYNIWAKRTGPRTKDVSVIIKDLNQKASGPYGKANITGQGLNEPWGWGKNVKPPSSPKTTTSVSVPEPKTPTPGSSAPKPSDGKGVGSIFGKMLTVIGIGTSIYNTATADDPMKQAGIEQGRWVGGFTGAKIGAVFGPWGAILGGITGAIVGGELMNPDNFYGGEPTVELGERSKEIQKEMDRRQIEKSLKSDIFKEPTLPGVAGGPADIGYDPRFDPNLESRRKRKEKMIDTAKIDELTSDFQGSQPGTESTRGEGQPPQQIVQQPDTYAGTETVPEDKADKGYPQYPPYGPYPPNGPPPEEDFTDKDWTKWATEPRPAEQRGQETPPAQPKQPTETKPGIDVQIVGNAPPGKTIIVDGQLVPVDGYPVKIAGMTITLSGPVNISTKSSGGGNFSFKEIPSGDYVISVNEWNYGMTKQNFTAPSGKSVKIVLKGSCPYLYVWTGDGYEKENDIYSTARLMPSEIINDDERLYAQKDGLFLHRISLEDIPRGLRKERSYKDRYLITRPLRADGDGNYRLKIREQANEYSFTDAVGLIEIDHVSGSHIALDSRGKPFMYDGLKLAASYGNTDTGEDGIGLYNGEYIEIKLPENALRSGVMAVTWQGFMDGVADGHTSATGRPELALQRKSPGGGWVTVGFAYPRDEVQKSFFILKEMGEGWDEEGVVRLVSKSCDVDKYHRIDRVEWGKYLTDVQKVMYLPLTSAKRSDGEDVIDKLKKSDGEYLLLGPEEEVELLFKGKPITDGATRMFIFVSEGFYIPMPSIRVSLN